MSIIYALVADFRWMVKFRWLIIEPQLLKALFANRTLAFIARATRATQGLGLYRRWLLQQPDLIHAGGAIRQSIQSVQHLTVSRVLTRIANRHSACANSLSLYCYPKTRCRR